MPQKCCFEEKNVLLVLVGPKFIISVLSQRTHGCIEHILNNSQKPMHTYTYLYFYKECPKSVVLKKKKIVLLVLVGPRFIISVLLIVLQESIEPLSTKYHIM